MRVWSVELAVFIRSIDLKVTKSRCVLELRWGLVLLRRTRSRQRTMMLSDREVAMFVKFVTVVVRELASGAPIALDESSGLIYDALREDEFMRKRRGEAGQDTVFFRC